MPLVRRPQGLQYGRDLGAKECILFATGITNKTEYLTRINKIRKDSKALINNEIKHGLGQLGIGTTPNQPNSPVYRVNQAHQTDITVEPLSDRLLLIR